MNIAKRFAMPVQMRHILLIQLGDIGDVVWSLPAFGAVRAAYPEASLSVLVREGNGSLLAAEAFPPGIFEVSKGKHGLASRFISSLRLVSALRRARFDAVFDFRADERGGYTAFATGAPLRAAMYLPSHPGPRNHLFTHLVRPGVMPQGVGAADYSLHVLRAFGIETKDAIPRLNLSAEVRRRAAEILAGIGIVNHTGGEAGQGKVSPKPHARKWVTVNPFSRWAYKDWALEKWGKVIDWLWDSCGLATVIVGSLSEREGAAGLARLCSGEVFNLAGMTTLAEMAGVLEQSRLHIGVDSAGPHIAAAVGTPTVTIYGPSDWRYWAPLGEHHRVAVPDMDCAPCHKKGCEGLGESFCLNNLEIDRVKGVIEKTLTDLLKSHEK